MERTIEEQAKRYASSEIESGGLCGLNGIDASKYQPFIDGANWLKSLLLEKLQVYKGAMILDGYEPEDSCIKFMNELIEEINGEEYSSWISVEKRLPKENTGVFFKVQWKDNHNGYFVGVYYGNECWESDHRIFTPNTQVGIVTHWRPIPE